MNCLFERTRKTLHRAREEYGYKNQVLVAVEELNELSCALAKYPRYDDHEKAVAELREHVLEECADVLNVLDHIQAIFHITDAQIVHTAAKKGDRLAHWLKQGKTLEASTEEREIPEEPCEECIYRGANRFAMPCILCSTRPGYEGFAPRIDL